MKKYLPHLIVGIVLCWGIISMSRACKITDKYSRLVGQYEQMRKAYDADAILKDSLIAAKEKAIAELDKKLYTSEQVIGHMTTAIGQKDRELADIRGTWANLSTECRFKLRELDDTWGGKYRLLEGVVVEKDKQITAWAGKYDAQLEITESYKSQLAGTERLLTISQSLNKALVRKAKVQAVVSNIEKVGLGILGAYVVYDKLKGK